MVFHVAEYCSASDLRAWDTDDEHTLEGKDGPP